MFCKSAAHQEPQWKSVESTAVVDRCADVKTRATKVQHSIFSADTTLKGDLKTEGDIDYQDPGGKKTDILLLIDARKVGVSVTRFTTIASPHTTRALTTARRRVGTASPAARPCSPATA